MGKYIVVGVACLDIVSMCHEFPKEDVQQPVLDYYWQRGGNAANSCSVLAMLGADTEFMGTLATDMEGSFIRENFESYGVKFNNCKIFNTTETGIKTSVSMVIINNTNGSRTILHCAKNIPELLFNDFCNADLNNYEWIHFEGRPNLEEMQKMFEHVENFNQNLPKEKRIHISLELEKPNRKYLDPLIQKVDYVFISKEKAEEAGCKNKEEAALHFVQFCKTGASVICPWGEQGAIIMTTNGDTFSSPAFPPEKVIDTLGAGDTFNAATIFALGQGQSLPKAITFGCRIAGAKCGMKGNLGLRYLDLNF